MDKVTAIILGKGGSRGIPGKNLIDIDGTALIGYAIDHAREAERVRRIIVSTDRENIASYAEKRGAEVPFMRPAHLATSSATMISGLKHALSWLDENGQSPDIILYLKATIPFREPGIIDNVIKKLQANPDLDTCFAAVRSGTKFYRRIMNGFKQYAADLPQASSRQDRESDSFNCIYEECAGVACASRAHVIRDTDHYVGSKVDIVEITDKTNRIDIDDYYDLWLAEKVAKEWLPVTRFQSGKKC